MAIAGHIKCKDWNFLLGMTFHLWFIAYSEILVPVLGIVEILLVRPKEYLLSILFLLVTHPQYIMNTSIIQFFLIHTLL